MASSSSLAADPSLRISAEFLEMPGLRLTLSQASRLFGLDVTQCESLLDRLVDDGFLVRHAGQYTRPSYDRSLQRAFWS